MSFETYQPIIGEKKESIDEKWYRRFSVCGSFSDYEYLGGQKEIREKQRDRFILGECENPTLDYPDLERIDIRPVA